VNASANVVVTINTLPNIDSINLNSTDYCQGDAVTISIANAAGLSDGNYQFDFSIPSGIPSTGNSGTVAVLNGNGQFSIPASFFTTAGSYTLTINSITNLTTNCINANENASFTFNIKATPNISGALLNAATTICLGSSNEVFITNATNIINGSYTLDYQLSGANSSSETVTLNFVNGSSSFIIPSSVLGLSGVQTLAFTQITSQANSCGVAITTILPLQFSISEAATPQLITDGETFCADLNATIADLTANITGTVTIVWYDSATGGVAYLPTAILQNGVTYYASATNSDGCISSTRLQVTAVIEPCNIFIPDGFSPNGDGINDAFIVENIAVLYPKFTIEIFNRYGNVLFKGDINKPNWDGKSSEGITFGDGLLPTGVYFFIIEFNDEVRKPLQGRVYLSR